MRSSFGLISVCVALRLTAVTTPAICVLNRSPDLLRLREGWCPESDLNRRPTAYEAVALPLSYRGSRLRPAPLTYRIVTAPPSRSAALRQPAAAARAASAAGRSLPHRRRSVWRRAPEHARRRCRNRRNIGTPPAIRRSRHG